MKLQFSSCGRQGLLSTVLAAGVAAALFCPANANASLISAVQSTAAAPGSFGQCVRRGVDQYRTIRDYGGRFHIRHFDRQSKHQFSGRQYVDFRALHLRRLVSIRPGLDGSHERAVLSHFGCFSGCVLGFNAGGRYYGGAWSCPLRCVARRGSGDFSGDFGGFSDDQSVGSDRGKSGNPDAVCRADYDHRHHSHT